MPSEILWGHRFEQMQIYRKDRNKFEINFSAFHSTYEVDSSPYSAKELDMMNKPRESKIEKVFGGRKGWVIKVVVGAFH